MNEKTGSFEFGISRHAPKVGEDRALNVFLQKVDREKAGVDIQPRTKYILDNLRQAPQGSILVFEPSNIVRSEETRQMYLDELQRQLEENENIGIVELGKDKDKAMRTLVNIRNDKGKKFIISDLRGTWLIGFKDSDEILPVVHSWMKILNGDENLVAKVWAARIEELPVLANELKSNGISMSSGDIVPSEFINTPEEQVLRFTKWMSAMKRFGEKYFPQRNIILEGISHNQRSDFTTLALLGEDISLDSINRVLGGQLRKPFERSSFHFDTQGNVIIKYRDLERRYSADEFSVLVNGVSDKAKARKREWSAV